MIIVHPDGSQEWEPDEGFHWCKVHSTPDECAKDWKNCKLKEVGDERTDTSTHNDEG